MNTKYQIEQYVLNSLIDTEYRQFGLSHLSEKDFTLEHHKRIFKAIKSEQNITREMLQGKFLSRDVEVFNALVQIELNIPTMRGIENFKYWINLLKVEKSRNELVQQLIQSSDIYDIDTLQEQLQKLTSVIEDTKMNIVDNKQPILNSLDSFMTYRKSDKPTYKTGFDSLDKLLGNGFYTGLHVLGGLSSLGKTALIHHIADNIANQGVDVLFFSLEMSEFDLIARSLSRVTYQQDMVSISQGSIKDNITKHDPIVMKARLYYEQSVSSKHFYVFEGAFNMNIEYIKRTIDQHVAVTKRKPFVVVDYLQIIQPPQNRNMSDKQVVDYNISNLKQISVQYDIPVVAISSLNRQSYTSPVTFESFKESGAIEYSADSVLGLQLDIFDNNELDGLQKDEKNELINRKKSELIRNIQVVILKNRNGVPFGKTSLKFKADSNYFFEPKESHVKKLTI